MSARTGKLPPSEQDALLAVAVQAARDAGEVLLQHFGQLDEREIGRKSSVRDLVTAADVASERLLVERLRAACPGHAIEAEEEVQDPADDRPRWFLDPLDGTVNFVHRLPLFGVSMGLFIDGEPELAVVHAPRLGETFVAARGAGATCNGKAMSVTDTTELAQAVLATGFPYRRGELEHSNLENFASLFYEVRGLRRMGSAALDLAFLADGRLDGFWELHLSPHDVAAGALLVQEAGGLVTDAAGRQGWLRGGNIVAAGSGLHEKIRARIVC